MIGAVLPWKPRILRLQIHFCPGAMWELLAVMQPRFFAGFDVFIVCSNVVPMVCVK